MLKQAGVKLGDVAGALGTQSSAAVAVDADHPDSPLVAVRTKPDDLAAAHRVVAAINGLEGDDPKIVTATDGDLFTAANNAGWLADVRAGGSLGSTDGFSEAVGPLDGTVLALGYVDVDTIATATHNDSEATSHVDAVGFAAMRDGDTSTFRLRLVAR